MGQDPIERKKQYIAAAILIAVIVSAASILIALTQQEEEGVVIDTNPLAQMPGSSTPVEPTQTPSQPGGKTAETGAEISVAPSRVNVPGKIEVQGSGFEAEERVTVSIKNTALGTSPPAVTADGQGGFSAEAAVPALPAGQYNIIATGNAGSMAATYVRIS